MKDIARELGVSVATVSRALKDSPRISQAQRERIQAFAQAHRFTPNYVAETLRNSRVRPQKIIGVIIPQFAHFYFSSILSGIEQEASARGYSIMVAQSDEQYAREVRICKSFYEHKVCGIIVSQAKDTERYEHFEHLDAAGVPLVITLQILLQVLLGGEPELGKLSIYVAILVGLECGRAELAVALGELVCVVETVGAGHVLCISALNPVDCVIVQRVLLPGRRCDGPHVVRRRLARPGSLRLRGHLTRCFKNTACSLGRLGRSSRALPANTGSKYAHLFTSLPATLPDDFLVLVLVLAVLLLPL